MLWSYEYSSGIFKKKLVAIEAITNFRVFTYNFENDILTGLLYMNSIDDVIVENRRRRSSSDRVGTFAGSYRKGNFGGVSYSHSEGTSRSVGDLRFMKNGETYMIFRYVSDPSAIQRLIKSIQKQMFPKKEIEEFIRLEKEKNRPELPKTSDGGFCDKCNSTNPPDARFCLSCGNKMIPICLKCKKVNPKEASFCGNCGSPLE